jgi:hypothetical protein
MTLFKETQLLKNLPGRTLQLSLIGLAISVGVTIYFYSLGLKQSSIMMSCFSVVLVSILALQLSKVIKDAHSLVIGAVCVLLIVSGFVEGSATGQYFYFFPIIVVVPIVVDSRDSSKMEFILTFTLVVVSFAICFYAGHNFKPFESISPEAATKITYSNAAGAVATTLLFSIANVLYERKFVRALNTIAHLQSHEMRKPVASILGLMDIWKNEKYNYDSEIVSMMESAVTELDEKIHLIVKHTSDNLKTPGQDMPVQ